VLVTRWFGFALLAIAAIGVAPPAIAQSPCRDGFALVPSGQFVAGSDEGERDYAYAISAAAAASDPEAIPTVERQLREARWFEGERASQTLGIAPVCVARRLVTNADYRAFVEDTGRQPPGISAEAYQEQGFLVHPYATVESFLWRDGAFPEGEGEHPVVLVSYDDAIAYAEWRSEHDGVTYRLPSEAEWEKAARGTDGRYFPWGNDWDEEATNWGTEPKRTSAVGTYPRSRSLYGIEDMAGNVFEYTSTLVETGDGSFVLMKGCSWDDLPGFCRAAYRHLRPTDSRHILFGFRLAYDAPSAPAAGADAIREPAREGSGTPKAAPEQN